MVRAHIRATRRVEHRHSADVISVAGTRRRRRPRALHYGHRRGGACTPVRDGVALRSHDNESLDRDHTQGTLGNVRPAHVRGARQHVAATARPNLPAHTIARRRYRRRSDVASWRHCRRVAGVGELGAGHLPEADRLLLRDRRCSITGRRSRDAVLATGGADDPTADTGPVRHRTRLLALPRPRPALEQHARHVPRRPSRDAASVRRGPRRRARLVRLHLLLPHGDVTSVAPRARALPRDCGARVRHAAAVVAGRRRRSDVTSRGRRAARDRRLRDGRRHGRALLQLFPPAEADAVAASPALDRHVPAPVHQLPPQLLRQTQPQDAAAARRHVGERVARAGAVRRGVATRRSDAHVRPA